MSDGSVVPSSKHDVEAAERAVALGWPGVAPVLPELLEWLRDGNWPVAHALAPFLAGIGGPIVPSLRPILQGDDLLWTYWVIRTVLADAPLTVVEQLRPDLERLVTNPTASEAEEELPEAAKDVLGRLRGHATTSSFTPPQ